jgi:hypothetical protein
MRREDEVDAKAGARAFYAKCAFREVENTVV